MKKESLMQHIDISQSQEIFTVTQLNREVRFVLEGNFPLLWVEGEISNFACPHSGHWYFSLKDPNAQVRCAMFKLQNRALGFKPKDGMHVMIKARVSLYEGRGDFQLLAEYMEEIGEGKLQRAFEALKKKLSAAGLFDQQHKQLLPAYPKQIGVITSPTGAAIRDIISVLKRRFPSIPIIIYPTQVQGDAAAPLIVKAIQLANQRKECDVLILARGGGSLEDLWPFNEEQVAHAIFQSVVPIISGVGHEVDFTIADFIADVRAPTPSAAAELIVPDADELLMKLNSIQSRFVRLIQETLKKNQLQLKWAIQHLQLQHPKRRLLEQNQRLDLYDIALRRLMKAAETLFQQKIANLQTKLLSLTPLLKIQTLQNQLIHQMNYLHRAELQHLQLAAHSIQQAATQLDSLSPLATLKRGYAIATHKQHVLNNSSQVKVSDEIEVTLLEGKLTCLITGVS